MHNYEESSKLTTKGGVLWNSKDDSYNSFINKSVQYGSNKVHYKHHYNKMRHLLS